MTDASLRLIKNNFTAAVAPRLATAQDWLISKTKYDRNRSSVPSFVAVRATSNQPVQHHLGSASSTNRYTSSHGYWCVRSVMAAVLQLLGCNYFFFQISYLRRYIYFSSLFFISFGTHRYFHPKVPGIWLHDCQIRGPAWLQRDVVRREDYM